VAVNSYKDFVAIGDTSNGSHIIIETETPQHQRLSVPDHHPLRTGTLNAILRTVAAHKGVSREEILRSL